MKIDLKNVDFKNYKTPGYFYFEAALKRQFYHLKNALPDNSYLFYSLKANPHKQIVATLNKCGAYFDVASLKELETVLSAKVDSKKIEFTGPGKDLDSLTLAVKNKVQYIIVESIQELKLINKISKQNNITAHILVRINPLQHHSPSGKLIAAASSQFGIDEEQLPHFFSELKKTDNINFQGFHIYTKSQILDAALLLNNFSDAISAVKKTAEFYKNDIKLLNLGGGFGIPYYPHQQPLNLTQVKERLPSILDEVRKDLRLKNSAISFESGRFIVGPSGYYCAQVAYTKSSRGKRIAILNGGFSHNMAACGFGQLFKKNYLIDVVQNSTRTHNEIVTLVGPSCYSLDVLAEDIELPALEVGDLVLIHNCGSYGPSFSPQNFLGFEPCAEYFMEET